MPVEIMLLPSWFPFHLDKISYWARTVIVPLLVLHGAQAAGAQPEGRRASTNCSSSRPTTVGPTPKAPHQKRVLVRVLPRRRPRAARDRAAVPEAACASARSTRRVAFVDRAAERRGRPRRDLSRRWPTRVMMFDVLGYPRRPSASARSRGSSIDKLLVVKDDEAYCQPCVSPVWDTGARLPRAARGRRRRRRSARRNAGSTGWSRCRCSTCRATGPRARPDVRPGGWAFQYANAHYPDRRRHRGGGDGDGPRAEACDGRRDYRAGDRRAAREWIVGLQSRNGGWGAFDADNDYYYLNHIPFADHGALLDPPTADVTARCVSMLAQLGETPKTDPRDGARQSTICAATQLAGRQLVRPLGHELHLRHLVGAVRAQRRRRRPRRTR